jgi:hypothetical protein
LPSKARPLALMSRQPMTVIRPASAFAKSIVQMPIIHMVNSDMPAKDFDFNLLKVLDALIAERNVTRAGKRLR